MQQYRVFAQDVRKLYETTKLTYDEIARELGVSNGTVSRSVAYLKKHEGLKGRGCGKNNRRRNRPGPSPIGGRVYPTNEPAESQYVARDPCPRCGVRADKHGQTCRMVTHPTSYAILAQPSYIDRQWEREVARAYEGASA